MDLAQGSLVQVDAQRNALLGTSLARGLHSVLLRADKAATFDRETNSFIFSSPAKLESVAKALSRMEAAKAYPVEGTYASSLEGWHDQLRAKRTEMNGHEVVQFITGGEFSRGLKGLSLIEDAVHMEPQRLINDPNAVFARPQLQELGVVYLPDAQAYLVLNPANEAAVAIQLAEASKPTEMQMKTIEVGLDMLHVKDIKAIGAPDIGDFALNDGNEEPYDVFAYKAAVWQFHSSYDRFTASNVIEQLNAKIGPELEIAVAELYPNLAAEAQQTIQAMATEATAARAAAILTQTVAPEITGDYKGTRAKESDIFADREAERDKLDPLRVLPIGDMDPKAGSLASLGNALRDIRDAGEATIKGWRMAGPTEVVTAPVAAQNRDWIIQRDDKGMAIIHDAEILDVLMDKRAYGDDALNKRPRVVEDLRLNVTLGIDQEGKLKFEQPEIDLTREVDPSIAWAMGSPKGGYVNSPEFVASSNTARLAERSATKAYALSGHREAQAIAVAELARRGYDPDAAKRVMPEPTAISRPHRGEVIGQTRDGMFTVLQMLPRPENKPAKVMTIETVTLLGEKLVTGDLRKGDYISFGLEKVADTIMPIQVTRIASPEQSAALAASRAAGMVNISEPSISRVSERVEQAAIQKFNEWHRGKTGFSPREETVVIDPQVGSAYAGPIVGFAGKYAIQNLGPGEDGRPEITLVNCEMVPRDQLHFVSTDMVLTVAYNHEEMSMVDPLTITDARPLRDFGYAFDADLANELRVDNPALAKSIEKALGIADKDSNLAKADKTAVLEKWSSGQDVGR